MMPMNGFAARMGPMRPQGMPGMSAPQTMHMPQAPQMPVGNPGMQVFGGMPPQAPQMGPRPMPMMGAMQPPNPYMADQGQNFLRQRLGMY